MSIYPQELLPKNAYTFLFGYRGSKAHRTYIDPADPKSIDDIDVMGICIAEPSVYMGLRSFEQKELMVDSWDSVVYEARKFFRLLLKANPNVLSLLYLEPEDYLILEPEGKLLLESRDLFASKRIYPSFIGYAHGQLKRMTHGNYGGFQGARRKEMFKNLGYDAKNGAHLIRILRMGIEYLRDGYLTIARPDARELVDIKLGNRSLLWIEREADALFAAAKDALAKSQLPNEPQNTAVEELLIGIVSRHLNRLRVKSTEGRIIPVSEPVTSPAP